MSQVAISPVRRRPAPRAWGLGVCAAAAAAVVLLPLAYLLVRTVDGGNDSLTVLTRASTWRLALNSVALALTVSTASLALAGALAWITGARDLPFRRVWTILAVAPLAAPCYLGATVYLAGLSPRGPLGSAWEAMGLGRPPVLSGFWPAAFILTIFVYPYVYLPLRAACSRADRGPYEAARTLGKSPLRAFVTGVAPQLVPAAVGGWLFVGLYTLSEFGAVSLLRYDTFTRAIYLSYSSLFDRHTPATLSLILAVIALGFLFASDRFGGRGRADRRTGDHAHPLEWRLRNAKWAGMAISSLAALVSCGVVLIVAIDWATSVEFTSRTLEAAINTGALAALAATLAVIAGWPIAHLVVRRRSLFSIGVERVSHLGFALPGVVAGLGLAFFAMRTPFYQTWGVLIVAYLAMFLAQAVTPLRATIGRISPQTEEAARTLGRSRARVFFDITLPQAGPGVVGAWLLVLITTARELPATLLLKPTGVRTLSTELWDAMTEAEYSRAAAPAIALLLVSCLAVVLTLRREGLG